MLNNHFNNNTTEVMEKPLLSKFKMPQLATYLGKWDPHDRIQNYKSIVLLYVWEDAIMYQAFSLTLTDYAWTWFNSLIEGFISSFEQLKREFIKAFITKSSGKKNATYLLNIKQEGKETFMQYED